MRHYVHEIPGRLRIRVQSLKRSPLAGQRLRAYLTEVPGIDSTFVSPMTGSVTIHYNPDVVSSHVILNLLARAKYVDPEMVMSSQQYVEAILSDAAAKVSRAVLGIALDKALQGSPLSILTAFI